MDPADIATIVLACFLLGGLYWLSRRSHSAPCEDRDRQRSGTHADETLAVRVAIHDDSPATNYIAHGGHQSSSTQHGRDMHPSHRAAEENGEQRHAQKSTSASTFPSCSR
jgi:hypothetical protein